MKATDLMVGDWVNYKSPSSGKLQPIKIENIYGCEFNCEVEDWNIISGKSISDTEPIGLTEDILVKNGLNWDIIAKFNAALMAYICGEIKCDNDWRTPRIRYVHQLQHLLRLCGIEKEIEL